MQVACLSTGISKGMAALHLQNICHYSLTSSNILLDRGGNPKVSDWGAQPRDDAPAKPVTAYMPPQMLSGNYSRKGDLWEFAVLVCEMILGSVPSVEPLKDTTQTSAFIENQLRQMSPSSRKETNKLLGMPSFTSSMMATCLGRREACLKVTEGCLVGSFPIFTPLITRCLSISESERPEFYIAERLLSVTLSEALYPEEFTTDAINLCLSALGSSITTLAYSAANSE
ncbi:hypothetical protein Pelo_611 [Pelomyxa schiedti]|nr:hypothetical protein Pelo_611 [Pelomyxa schiedti]